MQVSPLVGADLGVHLALHERVDEADFAVRPFPHEPDLTGLVQRGDGVFGVALHHVGDGGEVVGGVQDHRRYPQEVAGHVVGSGEPAPQDRIRAWQDDVLGQGRSRRAGDQVHCFAQEEGITAGQPEQAIHDGLVGLVTGSQHHANVFADVRPLQRDNGQGHVPGRRPFGHQVGELGVVAELQLAAAPVLVWLGSDWHCLLLAVADASTRPPARLNLEPEAEGGRGLALVEALSSRWGWHPVSTTGLTKVTWAEWRLPSGAGRRPATGVPSSRRSHRAEESTMPGPPVPDPSRSHDVSELTDGELERTRRDLQASLAPARPGAAARVPMRADLSAVESELAERSAGRPR